MFKKILIVDDNKHALAITSNILESAGLLVVGLEKAEEVAPCLERAALAGDPFDFCILDIQNHKKAARRYISILLMFFSQKIISSIRGWLK